MFLEILVALMILSGLLPVLLRSFQSIHELAQSVSHSWSEQQLMQETLDYLITDLHERKHFYLEKFKNNTNNSFHVEENIKYLLHQSNYHLIVKLTSLDNIEKGGILGQWIEIAIYCNPDNPKKRKKVMHYLFVTSE